MRIAFICYEYLHTGGIGVYSRRLVANLRAGGHEVLVFCSAASKELHAGVLDVAGTKEVPVSDVPLTAMATFWARLPQILRKEEERNGRFDIIHSNAIADAFLTKEGWPAPRVVTVYHLGWSVIRSGGLRVLLTPTSLRAEYGPLLALEGRSIHRADHIIAISDSTKRDLQAAYGMTDPRRITVIKPGVDPQRPAVNIEAAIRLRHKWKVSDTTKLLLFVGRIKYRKGVPLLLDVLNRLSDTDAKLVIVGGGDAAPILRKAERMGIRNRVLPAGYITDEELATAYGIAHVLVHPSVMEGYGLTLAEAFRSGLPVVAFRVGSVPEVVEDGVSGYLVEYPDTDAFADAVRAVLEDRLHARRKRNKDTPHHDWGQVARMTLDVYGELLSPLNESVNEPNAQGGG